jgi:hypothetical protein
MDPEQGSRTLQENAAAEEHLLVQQWGFSVTVSVTPPLWKEAPVAEECKRAPGAHHRTYNNPLYTSEEASTSSYSDTGEAAPDGNIHMLGM